MRMRVLEPQLGRIYCRFNKDIDDFEKMRLLDIVVTNDEELYIFRKLDDDYNSFGPEIQISEKEYDQFSYNWNLLESDGVVTISNIVAVENEVRKVRDIVLIFFPNNKVTECPYVEQPHVVARQAIENIFDASGSTVGMSVSIETLPTGYSLSDFMENASIESSRACHVYKIDTAKTLSEVLSNDKTDSILNDLYEHHYNYLRNTIPSFEDDYNDTTKYDHECLNGYHKTLEGFIKGSGFLDDILQTIGISTVDFELEFNKPLTVDELCFVSVLYGGIKINKAVPIRFDYDIELDYLKMKYLLLRDSKDKTWVVPYTVSPDEIDAIALYGLTDQKSLEIQERLRRCTHVYLDSKK